ncbi:MAG TPA: site-specific integrase [Thermoplasmata archaeon]|nr:site-specific integrase [Thermoplasmata archaeon]
MGRYPFLNRVDEYLRDLTCAEPTYRERKRKLLMLGHEYNRILDEHPGLIADPKKFTEREVRVFLNWMRGKGFGVAYQVKLVQYLRLMLRYFGNPAFDRMKANRELPRPARKRLHAPNHDEILDILQRLEKVDGWQGAALRFAVLMHYNTGLRVKELRLASLRDLDLSRMRFVVMHPKGEGVWADAGRIVKLPNNILTAVHDFFDARAEHCREMKLDPTNVAPLFPAWDGRFYSEPGWRHMRVKVFKRLGIEGNFRELRPAHAMRLKKLGVPIEAVSQRLGHADTLTTERSYARIEDEDAEDLILKVWESASR